MLQMLDGEKGTHGISFRIRRRTRIVTFFFFFNSKVGTFWIYGGKQFTAPSDKLRGFFMCLS